MSALTRLAARVADLERRVGPDATPAPQSDAPAASVKWPGEATTEYLANKNIRVCTGDEITDYAIPFSAHQRKIGWDECLAACKRAHAAALSDAPPATGDADDGGPGMSDAEMLLRAAAIYSINSGHDHRRVFSKMKAMADRLSASTAAAKEGE